MSFFRRIAIFAALAATLGCAPRAAHAQFLGYTFPQTVTSTPFNNTLCTGSEQDAAISNLGQISHTASIIAGTPQPAGVQVLIKASYDGSNYFPISDVGTNVFLAQGGSITGSGYYPAIEVAVTCQSASGRFTVQYTGTGGTLGPTVGAPLQAQVLKIVTGDTDASADFNFGSVPLQAPYGNMAGYLIYSQLTGGSTGGSLTVTCFNQEVDPAFSETYALRATGAAQPLLVPSYPCPNISIAYTHGTSTGTFELEYNFFQPGAAASYAPISQHITTTSAVSVKGTAGSLIDLIVGTPAAGTITVTDLPLASCTGTPATNVIAVITATTTAPVGTIHFGSFFHEGICVKASATMDITALAQ